MTEAPLSPQPDAATSLPAWVLKQFDGRDLEARVGKAVRLTTVDQDGWPRAAMLSAGEVLAIDQTHLKFAIKPDTTTTANIERSGRVTFSLVHDGALWEIRLLAKRGGSQDFGHNTALFSAVVESVRGHRVPYADVVSDVTYSLKDAGPVIERWSRQIQALRTIT